AQFSVARQSASYRPNEERAGGADGGAQMPAGYSRRLYNEDLAPLASQRWGAYNIFAFWRSDVHSVGGYVLAGSLFALGLT
ncbi:NCS1 family nucleobase:cation symporter-1, partial [Burkholderia pseudomallei]